MAVCPVHHGCNAEATGRLRARGCWVGAWVCGHIVQRVLYQIQQFRGCL
ncbi:hypothetical protein RK21_03256 [Pseudomonas plecoglossicida]|nr:hypothetical protein RK21_03256 [Pseudomonas plecoglossicida]